MAERLSGAPALVRPALEVLTRSPDLGAVLLGIALVVELGGAVFWWPRGRLPWAVAVTLMHAGIGLALGYVYAEWVLAIWALVVWTRLKATAPAAPG
ncbi:MAG: hypothetical protein H6732_12760 [Alphaproteobacteria bacterium]|nr:hypothetical protein [Alphaproteobacteria bacterium]